MSEPIANVEMAKAWDGEEGEDWATEWEWYDRASLVHHDAVVAAAAFGAGERVLDIGCGNGKLTRVAARAVAPATALGVDLSGPMLVRARGLAEAQGVDNVEFVKADVQVHPFPTAAYDVAVSRFGVMFFSDPVAAFTNVARAMAPGGRVAFAVWRGVDANEWLHTVMTTFAAGRPLPLPPPGAAGAPGPLAWADPEVPTRVLTAAGFEDVAVEAFDGPFWAGADADQAFAFLSQRGVARGMMADLDDDTKARALDAFAGVLREHETPDGVLFGSGTWIVRARRP